MQTSWDFEQSVKKIVSLLQLNATPDQYATNSSLATTFFPKQMILFYNIRLLIEKKCSSCSQKPAKGFYPG